MDEGFRGEASVELLEFDGGFLAPLMEVLFGGGDEASKLSVGLDGLLDLLGRDGEVGVGSVRRARRTRPTFLALPRLEKALFEVGGQYRRNM